MKNIIGFLIFVQILGISFTNAVAKGRAGKYGFGVSAQQPTMALMGRYWLARNLAVDARFGFESNDRDIRVIGGSLLKTLGGAERVYYYFGGKIDIVNEDRGGNGDTTTSVGGIFGAEYFVVSRFSFVGESQLLIELGDSSIRTHTTLSVLFYLN